MQICQRCRKLNVGTVCEFCECGTRPVEENDAVFFAELSAVNEQMLAEVFRQNGIEHFSQPIFGGYSKTNEPNYYRVFVVWKQYGKACECYDVLWGKAELPTSQSVLGTVVQVTVDRPLGSVHPEHDDVVYAVNYGFVEGVLGGDGEAQDAYVLGVERAVETFQGEVIAVIVRDDDAETKWVVAPVGSNYTQEEISAAVNFQEKYFKSRIIVKG